MQACKRSFFVLVTGILCACGASTPQRVTHANEALAAAARDFSCPQQELRITDEEMGVFLIEGCDQMATYYCTETNTFDLDCDQVEDANSVDNVGSLEDVLSAHDKAERDKAEQTNEDPQPANSAAKQSP